MPSWFKIALVLGALVGFVVYAMLNSRAGDAFAYSKPLNAVMADPDQFDGRLMRIEGQLRQGSIRFREDPCEWRFVLTEEDQEMPVQFPQCVVPDTFRDGMGIRVTVQGQLVDGGQSFLADEVIPRCPSKYEMQERLEAGEAMPHASNEPSI